MSESKQPNWVHWKCPKCQTEFASPIGCCKCPKCGFGCDGLQIVAFFDESELEQRGFSEKTHKGQIEKKE
jgi:hypothetical protein